MKPLIDYTEDYQREWKKHVNRSQNKFYIISQEDKAQSDIL